MEKTNENTMPGFMIYFDAINPFLKHMSNEEAGEMIRALTNYAYTGESPKDISPMAAIAIQIMQPSIDTGAERYADTVAKRKYATYVRECKKKKLVPLLFEQWNENGNGGENEANDDKWIDYNAYILSDEWKQKREQRLAMDGNKCQVCGAVDGLEVHHLTYRNLGHEEMDELITLCRDCHKKQHKAEQTIPR